MLVPFTHAESSCYTKVGFYQWVNQFNPLRLVKPRENYINDISFKIMVQFLFIMFIVNTIMVWYIII